MTVVNIHARPDRVWLASDTLVFQDNRPALLRHKFDVLPEIPAVMCCRGVVRMHQSLRDILEATPLDSIEALAERLALLAPGGFAKDHEGYRERCAERGLAPKEMIVEAWAVGWSPARDCFLVVRLSSEAGFAAEWLGPGSYLNPGFGDSFRPQGDCADPVKALVASAVLQEKLFRKAAAEGYGDLIAVGGELQLVEMTRHAMRITTPYRWPDYEVVKAEILDGHG